jgi:predicted small lipoprotein YifL
VHVRLASALAAILLASTGCGQKGPLYLRDAPPPGVKPAKPEVDKPVPYPKEPERDGSAAK